MENESVQSVDLLRLVAWANANKKPITYGASIVAAIAAVIGIYIWYHNHHETAANDALALLAENPARETTVDGAAPFLKLEENYAGTAAASHALLQAGQILFVAGKFDQAESQFGRFLRDYSASPLAGQAQVSLAACLEAEGKLDQALSNYKSVGEHDPTDSNIPQAKSAMGRIYVAQKKPDLALQQYEELMKAQGNDSWTMEAGIQREELLTAHPELIKKAPPVVMPPSSPTITMPGATNFPPPVNATTSTNAAAPIKLISTPPATNPPVTLITPAPAAKATNH